MPPKKSHQRAHTEREENRDVKKNNEQQQDDINSEEESNNNTGEKRKLPPCSAETKEPSSKAAKTEQQSREGAIIHFLLSPQALPLCQKGEKESSNASGKDYFFPGLTPFQHLMCAVILSCPISYTLGLRTIKTVLNEPWSWNNAEAVLEAGRDDEKGKTECVQAMEQARTQHRQKTASELGGLAQAVKDEGWDEAGDGSLKGLLNVVKGDKMPEQIRDMLKKKVKGVGDTGVDNFLRRLQGCRVWEGIGWFVDGKTKEVLQEIGLHGDSEALKMLLEQGEEKDVRGDFVVVLERSLGIFLEGKQKEVSECT